jgi:hypothetical protein
LNWQSSDDLNNSNISLLDYKHIKKQRKNDFKEIYAFFAIHRTASIANWKIRFPDGKASFWINGSKY